MLIRERVDVNQIYKKARRARAIKIVDPDPYSELQILKAKVAVTRGLPGHMHRTLDFGARPTPEMVHLLSLRLRSTSQIRAVLIRIKKKYHMGNRSISELLSSEQFAREVTLPPKFHRHIIEETSANDGESHDSSLL